MQRYTVAILPRPDPTSGQLTARITDALDPVRGSPAVGGGNQSCDVRWDGLQWIVIRVPGE